MTSLYSRLCVAAASGYDIYVTYQGKTHDISMDLLVQAMRSEHQGILSEKDGVLHVLIGGKYVDWRKCGFTIVEKRRWRQGRGQVPRTEKMPGFIREMS